MRNSKRWVATAAVVGLGASLFAATSTSASADTFDPDTERFAGADRFATAAAVSEEIATCDITLANGRNFPDALAASALGNPILFVEQDSIPAATLAEHVRLTDPDNCGPGGLDITIVGGTAAVSSSLVEPLLGFGSVERLSGANRYETALAIADEVGGTTVIMTTGQNFPDALVASVIAADYGYPIILNDGPSVRADVAAFLVAEGIQDVIIVGGTAVVPQSVEDELDDAFGIDVERLSGANRFATAVAVAEWLADDDSAYLNGVILANGRDFPDALVAGPLGAAYVYPVLLVETGSIPTPTAEWHIENSDTIEEILAVGGTAVVSDAVLNGAAGAAAAVAPLLTSATLAKTNTQRVVVFENAASETLLTLTAVAGSVADGAEANGWDVLTNQTVIASEFGVEVDADAREFTISANFNEITGTALAALWNGSDAAALLSAAGTANVLVEEADFAVATNTEGTTDVTVVATFNRAIEDPGADFPTNGFRIFDRNGPLGVAQLDQEADNGDITWAAAAPNVVTVEWTGLTDIDDVPMLGVSEVRIADGAVDTAAGSNTAEIIRRLTAAS